MLLTRPIIPQKRKNGGCYQGLEILWIRFGQLDEFPINLGGRLASFALF